MNFISRFLASFREPKTELQPIFNIYYVFSKLYGHFIFTVPSDIEERTIIITYKDKLWFLIVTFVNLIQVWLTFTEYIYDYRRGTTLYDVGNVVIVVFGVMLTLIMTWLNLLYQNAYWNMFQMLNDIDGRLIRLDIQMNYEYQFKQTIRYLIIKHLLFLSGIALEELANNQNDISNFKYSFIKYYAFGTIDLCLGTFIVVIQAVYDRLKYLNQIIAIHFNLHNDMDVITIRTSNKLNIDWLFTEFSAIYIKIVKLMIMNTYNTFVKILFSLFVFFIYTLLTLFALYYIINLDPKINDILMLLSNLYWNCLYLTQVVHITIIGSSFIEQANLTASLIYSAINRYSDKQLQDKLLLFSIQVTHKIPEVSTKLFIVDWKLILAIGTSLASYLVILIQVQGEVAPNSLK